MNEYVWIIIVITGLFISYDFILKFLEKRQSDKLIICLTKQDFATFDNIVESKLTKTVIKPFNLNFLKLNAAIMKNDSKEIDKLFDYIDKSKMNKTQYEAFFNKAFEYYVFHNNKAKAEYYLKKIQTYLDNIYIKQAEMSFDIKFEKSFKYLKEILEIEKSAEPKDLVIIWSLIAQMYSNKGDNEKAKEYIQKVNQQLKI